MDTKEEHKSPTASGLKFVMKTEKHFSSLGETQNFVQWVSCLLEKEIFLNFLFYHYYLPSNLKVDM